MIAKDPGSCKIECIHVIHLFEANYNFTLKLWGKRLIYQGEDHNYFGHQQLAHFGHQSIDSSTRKPEGQFGSL
jgi:hypothetical protein